MRSGALLALGFLLAGFGVEAGVLTPGSYPARSVRIIVPTAPNGPPELVARLLSHELANRWGRSVVVEARPGAGTIIGTEAVARAAPDGYTLLLAPTALATNPAVFKKMPYDVLRDFAPITQTHFVPNLLVVHPSVPARSVRELVALARTRPARIQYGSAGQGTAPHLATELFASMTKIKLDHVPYKGSVPSVANLLAGRVVMTISSTIGVLLPHVRAGKLRALAVTSARRSTSLPELPSIAETVQGFDAVQWAALMAPAGTPMAIVSRLHREIVSILGVEEIKRRLATDMIEVVGSTPDELRAYLHSEIAKWEKAARAAGIEPQ
jgi:tripartite-type tricarboxylate transporter receptor subunit TctC